ncbi:MAG TPA: hypothetical protein VLF66_03180 [Thermoanaerobaculia bacterium]|nr:hypothetical protein [Thermoanaerobaculia bacterium]
MANRRIAGISLGLAVAAFLATALALVAAGLGWPGEAAPEPREVRLVARDMAFYLLGDATPNPTLRAAPGERLRIVLVNEEAGMTHDVVAEGLGLATRVIGKGETTSAVVRMPERPGAHEYLCSLHPVLMRGVIEVR